MFKSYLQMFMRALSWLLSLPVTIAVLLFVVDNRQKIDLSFWPFDLAVTAPLWLLTLSLFVVGFLLGGFVMWVSTLPYRRAAYKHAKEANALRLRLNDLSTQAANAAFTENRPSAKKDKPLAISA